ncbi:MAG: glycogen debranching enzyme family protein [Anaerolineae bacterium]|nr:glycogen debranching enzyme family protein [Phycisphaerae bacterium]
MALYSIETHGELQPNLEREWLLTNGMGSFASSTIVGCNTRRYHSLLCAATIPPVGRMVTLSRIGEIIQRPNQPMLELSVNQFADRFHPRGEKYLRRFELDDTARFYYDAEGTKVTKEVLLFWERNTAAVRYTIEPHDFKPLQFSMLPFMAMRDFHALRAVSTARFDVHHDRHAVTVRDRALSCHIRCDKGHFISQQDWWFGQLYAIELERGQDFTEDLYMPGRFVVEVTEPTTVTIWVSTESPDSVETIDFDAELRRRITHMNSVANVPKESPTTSKTIVRLTHAANDFVVRRKAPDNADAWTVIAGYPWFADWGRDTMIALPGLFLTTKRFKEAGRVLSVFAHYVSEGMIPNRFDDYTNQPHYNTVDASLWFIHAVHEYARLSGDSNLFDAILKPACRAIIEGYSRGTRFGIAMDPVDGLITQGDATTQLTWMDAKCGDVCFTPRQGKAVEINALWYNALKLMGDDPLAAKVAENFRKEFWVSPFRGLADVVHKSDRDEKIRPNQIFAVSLPHSALSREQQSAVVEVVRRELLTPVGLRTLGEKEAGYTPMYRGDQFARDRAYHNGTIWPWPIGAFLEAYVKVNDNSDAARNQAREWLQPLIDHLENAGCVGSISEIFEAQPPHRPVGCFAQAWSVSEVLRLAMMLGM